MKMHSISRGVRSEGQRGGVLSVLLIVVLVIVLVIVGYFLAAFNWAYSDGERAGIVQKFSRKGWVCKTWEGELAMSIVPGVTPTIWNFSVRDEKVAAEVSKVLGARAVLHYREHRGIPTSCFGETSFFVDGVRVEPK